MKVVTAPEKYIVKENDVCVFLAGGITNCENWQQAVIKELQDKLNTDYLVIYHQYIIKDFHKVKNIIFNESQFAINCIRQSLEELSCTVNFENLKDLYIQLKR